MVTPCMERVLGGFQEKVARLLVGQLTQQRLDGKCYYTSTEAARAEVGFELMKTYIRQRYNMVAQYIVM